MSTDTSAPIVVSALIIRNALGEVLTVRKRGTTGFMLPGGKPEPGETAEETARREAAEDVNMIDKWRGSAIALWLGSAIALWRGSAIALWRAGPTSHRKLSS